MTVTWEYMSPRYSSWLKAMQVKPAWQGAIDKAAKVCVDGMARYKTVAAQTGVPWAWIAVAQWREASGDFRGVLHNGEHIIGTGRRTSLVPAGRGPFSTWEESAYDALSIQGLVGKPASYWTFERICWDWERFNGLGYAQMGRPSPYLWSGTNIYEIGKYVSDGNYDPNVVDQQLGCVPLYFRILELAGETQLRTDSKKLVLLDYVRKGAQTVITAVSGWAATVHITDKQSLFNAGVAIALIVGAGLFWWLANRIDKMVVKDYKEGRYRPSGAPLPAAIPAPQPTKEIDMNGIFALLAPLIQQLLTGVITAATQPANTPAPALPPVTGPTVPTVTPPSDGTLDTFLKNLLKAVLIAAAAEVMKELPNLMKKAQA